jgi:RNA polymerase sigma-70 factor (ECF subfamily)
MRQELTQLGQGAHALAIQLLGNVDDAADAVHDAYVSVLARPQAYDRRKGPLRPWFLRVVRNRCVDMLRGRRPVNDRVAQVAADDPGPAEETEISQRRVFIQKVLSSMQPDHREIVILRDYLDLSYAEIGDVLGIAPGTVMSRLHRARLALREALSNYEG